MGDFSDDDFDGLAEDDLLALVEEISPEPTQILSQPLASYAPQGNVGQSIKQVQNSLRTENVGGLPNQSYGQRNGNLHSISRPTSTVFHDAQSSKIHEPGPSTQREQWRQSRYAATTPGLRKASAVGNINLPHREAANAKSSVLNHGTTDTTDTEPSNNDEPTNEVARLRAEVETMRTEQEKLKQVAKAANDQMLAKSGEISILRSNQARIQSDFERRLEDLQKKHTLDSERHQGELNESRKERERLASHNQFLTHERNDDNWQLKQGQKSATTEKKNQTPKKQKPTVFGDGFDDDEVMIISPSKSISKSRTTTPRGGAKRKRDALTDSPMKQLELSQSIGYLPDVDTANPVVVPEMTAGTIKHQESFKFLQQLLNRQMSRDDQRTYEILSEYFLPSDTRRSMSTILTGEMTLLSLDQDSEDFSSSIGHILLALWSKCLDEKYHTPIKYLLDLVEFTLLEGSNLVVANIIDEVVDLTQRTADVNIIPRYKRFKRKTVTDDPDNRPLDSDISTKQCLELLDMTITLCNQDQELIKRFWKSMRFDFISMLLRNSQDINDTILMIKILSRSVRTDTFAMIVAPPASQSVSEQHVIDRLSAMLIEIPRVIDGEHQPDALEICSLRLEILNLIEAMCLIRYCGEAFAQHPAALGRLVRVIHDELNALYEYRNDHEKRAQLVNQSTRLLYHINTEYIDAIGNLQEKLRNPPTSIYKYLIALSRLAFSEGVVFEQNIDEDVLEMAHEMLELFTSPDEAEAIQKAFVREDSRIATIQPSG